MSDLPFHRPLVILGPLGAGDHARVLDFVTALHAPVYAEALSGLREHPALDAISIRSGERLIGSGNFDGVVRIGGVPTLRFWRDLEESQRDLQVISYSSVPFAGLSRGTLKTLDQLPKPERRDRDNAFFERDARAAAAIGALLDEEPESEPAIVRRISRELPAGSRIYLGNSLPIREWDAFASHEARRFVVEGNRGANGIDGQISTFLGWCAPDADNVAVVGDLTALYDLNAPWIVPQLDSVTRFRIVIINNGGGRIFSRVPSLRKLDPSVRARIIENSHDVRFENWAAMWGLPYNVDAAARSVHEIRPDPEATARFWERYDAVW
jgi:2-succinyl-5-enolpyruvyl-6-hydroxy-3-cyclohexene-1-carboxylate synthase